MGSKHSEASHRTRLSQKRQPLGTLAADVLKHSTEQFWYLEANSKFEAPFRSLLTLFKYFSEFLMQLWALMELTRELTLMDLKKLMPELVDQDGASSFRPLVEGATMMTRVND